MTTEMDLNGEITRIEQRLEAGRAKIHHDWSSLTETIARKSSRVFVAAGVAGVAGVALWLLVSRKSATSLHSGSRGAWAAPAMPRRSGWSSLLAAAAVLLRLAGSAPVTALLRSWLSRRP